MGGGLVFVPLMQPYEALVPKKKMDQVMKLPENEQQQLVVVLMVLRAEVNIGYEDLSGLVSSFNGTKIKNLKHLQELVEGVTSGDMEFGLESGELIVMDSQQCRDSEPAIFTTH